MIKELELVLLPSEAVNKDVLNKKAASALHISPNKISEVKILKRSIDARLYRARINADYSGTRQRC